MRHTLPCPVCSPQTHPPMTNICHAYCVFAQALAFQVRSGELKPFRSSFQQFIFPYGHPFSHSSPLHQTYLVWSIPFIQQYSKIYTHVTSANLYKRLLLQFKRVQIYKVCPFVRSAKLLHLEVRNRARAIEARIGGRRG